MADSRRELLRNQLVSLFQVISEDNGYRTTPNVTDTFLMLHEVVNFPTVCVMVGDERFWWEDDARTLFTTHVRCTIRGYFQTTITGTDEYTYAAETAGEPLLHDMKQIFAGFLKLNINSAAENWVVTDDDPIIFRGPWGTQTLRGYVEIEFSARMKRQTSTFA